MKKNNLLSASLLGALILFVCIFGVFVLKTHAAPTANPGDIVINEMMINPAAVLDGSGEWFEIVNVTGSTIDINGWTIKDDGIDSHVINNGGALNVTPGSYVVLCRTSDSMTNGGFSCDYAYGTAISLANGADEIVLLDGTLTEIDRVAYDNTAGWTIPNGASLAYSVPDTGDPSNNLPANWAAATTTYGDGDFGTPGAKNEDWMGATAVNLQSISASAQPISPTAIAGFTLITLFVAIVVITRKQRKLS